MDAEDQADHPDPVLRLDELKVAGSSTDHGWQDIFDYRREIAAHQCDAFTRKLLEAADVGDSLGESSLTELTVALAGNLFGTVTRLGVDEDLRRLQRQARDVERTDECPALAEQIVRVWLA